MRTLLTTILLVISPITLSADDISYSENDVKVAFLYRSLLYVKWDNIIKNPAAPLVICTNTTPELSGVMKSLGDRLVGARKLEIKIVNKFSANSHCNVAYIHASTRDKYKSILKMFGKKQTLTINDNASFANDGGVLNFVLNNKRISIEINLDIAEQKNIQFSAKLLRVAKILRGQN